MKNIEIIKNEIIKNKTENKNIENKNTENKFIDNEIIENENLISESADSESADTDAVKKSKKAGFTLIELIVVIAIMSILVGLSAGSMVSVKRRKATSAGRVLDSELSVLASNAYSRAGAWRLEIFFDEDDGCYVLRQQNSMDGNVWNDYSSVRLPQNIDISFGGDEYNEDNSMRENDDLEVFISVSREKGHYLTEEDGYFCDKIYVHSASKTVTVEMFSESGGHRVID